MPCSGCLALHGVNPNYKKKIKKLLGLKLVLIFIFYKKMFFISPKKLFFCIIFASFPHLPDSKGQIKME